jgi:superfamily I DNA/RNA helicase
VIQIASHNAEKIRLAGDYAQTLFDYQGADPSILVNLTKKYPTKDLHKTYRLPKKICRVADAVIECMQNIPSREHTSVKEVEGEVREINDRELLYRMLKRDWEKNGHEDYKWFLLFRTNGHITDVASELERHLIPYHTALGFVVSERELNKIKRYLKYREAGYGSEDAKKHFMAQFGILDINADWTESNLIPSPRRYVYADYIEKYGINELSRMCYATPFCLLTTVHKVKGAEAKNVAFFLDATKQVSANTMISVDSELMVMYVACTRAKENLYIMRPESKYNLMSLWEGVVDMAGGKI